MDFEPKEEIQITVNHDKGTILVEKSVPIPDGPRQFGLFGSMVTFANCRLITESVERPIADVDESAPHRRSESR